MSLCLAFEGGATRTRAGLYAADGAPLAEAEGGPCNPVEYGVAASARTLIALGKKLLAEWDEAAVAVAAISGAMSAAERLMIGQRLCGRLGAERAVVSNDLYPMLVANAGASPGILVIAGTGSSVLAQDGRGTILKIGGRGSVIGDEGSAYGVAVSALRAAAHVVDGVQPACGLPETLVRAAGVTDFDALAAWTGGASKQRVAALAKAVANAAKEGDETALRCIEEAARALAAQVATAQHRLELAHQDVPVFLHGGIFEGNGAYRHAFSEALGASPGLAPCEPQRRGHDAARILVELRANTEWATVAVSDGGGVASSPTEARAAAEKTLDRMTSLEIVQHMNREDATITEAVAREAHAIAEAVEMAAQALLDGARLLYFGAGTSGRLGVLDASECPPTFGVAPERVVGMIAGGDAALRRSVEGEEDRSEAGAADVAVQGVGAADLVVGIAASGTTPYVLGSLEEARRRGAKTVLLTCNPHAPGSADTVIALDTGPEVLAGSTRLKAGTATKLVLNMISTGAMARAGFVYDGLMVCMKPANAKLRWRAVRIVSALTGVDEAQASHLLEQTGYEIAAAVLMGRVGLGPEAAQDALKAAGGVLRKALEGAAPEDGSGPAT